MSLSSRKHKLAWRVVQQTWAPKYGNCEKIEES